MYTFSSLSLQETWLHLAFPLSLKVAKGVIHFDNLSSEFKSLTLIPACCLLWNEPKSKACLYESSNWSWWSKKVSLWSFKIFSYEFVFFQSNISLIVESLSRPIWEIKTWSPFPITNIGKYSFVVSYLSLPLLESWTYLSTELKAYWYLLLATALWLSPQT